MKVPDEIRSFLAEAPWVPAVHALLGPDCVPLYDSAIVSVPGAKTQVDAPQAPRPPPSRPLASTLAPRTDPCAAVAPWPKLPAPEP